MPSFPPELPDLSSLPVPMGPMGVMGVAAAAPPTLAGRALARVGAAERQIWLLNPTQHTVTIVYIERGKGSVVESVGFPGNFELKFAQVCTRRPSESLCPWPLYPCSRPNS